MEPTANTAGLRFYSHIAPITLTQRRKKKGGGGGEKGGNIKVFERKSCSKKDFNHIK